MPNIDNISWFNSLDISSGGIYPFHRQQASRTAGGTSLVRDLGSQLWTAQFTTTPMSIDDAIDLESDLLSLSGSKHWVLLSDPKRSNPKLWDGSSSLTGYTYLSIESTNRHIVNLAVGSTDLSKGDYFHYENEGKVYLHKIVEMITTTQARIWPAMSLNAQTTDSIVVNNPYARFQIDPNSVNDPSISIDDNTKNARISFSGIQTLK